MTTPQYDRKAVACVLIAVFFLSFAHGLSAQEGAVVTSPTDLESSARIDWQTNTFSVDMRAEIPATGRSAAALHRARTRIDQRFPQTLFAALLPVPIDSRRHVEDAVREDPDLASRIAALAQHAERGLPQPAPDLGSIERSFNLPLFPNLTRLFVSHSVPYQMERVVRWVPTRRFSGIVIYAAEPLPLHGTGRGAAAPEEVALTPALLPEIYDTDLRPVLQQDMMDPAAIERWGVVHYTDSSDPDAWRERAGTQPLRIMARRAYGVIPTDIMISPADADRILASDHNRSLLRRGHIVVIVSPEQIDRLR